VFVVLYVNFSKQSHSTTRATIHVRKKKRIVQFSVYFVHVGQSSLAVTYNRRFSGYQ